MGSSHQDRFNNPDYGEQVSASVSGVGASSVVMHTVTAGFNFYPQQLTIVRATGNVRVYVTDSAGTFKYNLASATNSLSVNLRGCAPVPAGYLIKCIGTNADSANGATMLGKEEYA